MSIIIDELREKLTVVPIYISADSALEVKFNYDFSPDSLAYRLNKAIGIRGRTILLMYGSLTLTFSGDGLSLTNIDAYTNRSKWANENVALPPTASYARCSIQTSTADDRISYDYEPGYIFDDDGHRLLIKLSEQESTNFYRLADNLIVGIVGEKIASLIVESLVIR